MDVSRVFAPATSLIQRSPGCAMIAQVESVPTTLTVCGPKGWPCGYGLPEYGLTPPLDIDLFAYMTI